MHSKWAVKHLYVGQHEIGETNMNIRGRVKKYAEQRRAIRELSVLDDHALADIGLQRTEIRGAVLGR